MRPFGALLLTGLLSLAHPAVTQAGWGGGSCGPVGPLAMAPIAPPPLILSNPTPVAATLEWQPAPAGHGQEVLQRNGTPVALWSKPAGKVWLLVPGNPGEPDKLAFATAWDGVHPWTYFPSAPQRTVASIQAAMKPQGPCRPGCTCPNCGCPNGAPCVDGCRCGRQTETIDGVTTQNFGMEWHPRGEESITINGQPSSREAAIQAIEGKGQLQDDTKKPFLTVIGPVADRKKVLDDLQNHPALAALKDTYRLQAYTPEDWAVARYGFKTDGHPTIYMQKPDGTVLHRQDDYAGADDLAQLLRKANPDYHPDKDPDLRKPALPDLSQFATEPVLVFGALGVLVLLVLLKK